MKILYESTITKDTGFTATDFPDRFEILREGKTPLVFKPVAISMQEMYSRLNEAEQLLKAIQKNTSWTIHNNSIPNPQVRRSIDQYFERHAQ